MSGNKCCYLLCGKSKRTHPHLSFFRFPKEVSLAQKWIVYSGNAELSNMDENLLWRRFMCEEHFARESFVNGNRKKLMRNVLPLKYDPSLITEHDDLWFGEPTKAWPFAAQPEVILRTSTKQETSETSTQYHFIGPAHKLASFPNNRRPEHPKITKLKQTIQNQRKLLRNKRSEISKLRKSRLKRKLQLKERKSFNTESALNLLTFPSHASKTLVRMQVLHKKKGHWSLDELKLSLSIYNKSPGFYKFLRQQKIILPSISTLRTWIAKKQIDVKNSLNGEVKNTPNDEIKNIDNDKECPLI